MTGKWAILMRPAVKLLDLPGYSGFLNKKTVELERFEEGDKAREVLLNFKQGAWHRA